MSDTKKYLDYDGVSYLWEKIKAQLDTKAPAGAEVNQNAFANVKVGNVTIAADAKQDTLTIEAGSGVSITPDATNDKITIAVNSTISGLDSRVSATESAITTLNGSATTAGSVKKTVADAIAGVVASAPADFDTLKEVADWIANDTTGAAKMQSDIASLTEVKGNIGKVTSVGNHYTPSGGSAKAGTSGSAVSWGGAVVTGVTVDAAGHITGVTTGAIPSKPADTDTHYTTGINAGTSKTTSNNVASDPYITIKDNSTYRSQIQLKAGSNVSIASDASGVITISSSDTNTDTKVTSVDNHYTPSGGSAATLTAGGSTLSFGGAVVTGLTLDAAKHVTGVTTSKLPSNPNSDTKVKQTSSTSNANYPILMCTSASPTSGTAYESYYNTGVYCNPSTKSLYATNFYTTSDRNAKTNIKEIEGSDNCPTVKQFDWKENGNKSYGFIAQELEEQGYTELVDTDDNGMKTVNYNAALSLVIGKMQAKIEELEKKILELENK